MFGLSEDTIQKIISVFSHHPSIDDVIIYGSRAKGNYRNGSDIDLTVKTKEMSDREQFLIAEELDELNLPYTIDLSRYSQIENQNLIDHINRVGKIFYSAHSKLKV